MFLHQASLIPSTIALLDFFNKSFPNFFWYPYWYLGNPYNFLIGPVMPFLTLSLNRVFGLSTEQSFWVIFFISLLVGNITLYLFCKKLGATKLLSFLVVIANSSLPFTYIMLNFQNGLSHISLFLLPIVFLIFIDFLKKNSRFFDLLLILSISFLLLIDIEVIVPIIIGFLSLIIVLVERKLWIETIFKTSLIFFASLFLATTWYTFGFWQTLIFNPSFGGMPLINLLKLIFDLLLRIIPIIVAVWVVKIGRLKLNSLVFFGLLFSLSFGFLSILRFLSDPDFVLDWISYAQELQFGISFIAVGALSGVMLKQKLVLGGLVCLVAVLGWIKFFDLINDSTSKGFKANVLNLIGNNVEGNFFFSGSSVFFINQYKDLLQLRGGNDVASVHPTWAFAAYQIREGKSFQATENWLKALGISYILVHKQDSKDYFLDFKNSKKFKNLKPIGNSNSNILYIIGSNYSARLAEPTILEIEKPENGEDNIRLKKYTNTLKAEVRLKRKNNRVILDKIPEGSKTISLAQTFYPGWKPKTQNTQIRKDSLGNTVLVSESDLAEKVIIEYKLSIFSHVFPLLFFTIVLYLILKFKLIVKFIFKKISLD